MNPLDPRGAAIHADLHQVSMAAGCWDHGVTQRATFEISLAALPPGHGFMISSGLDPVLQYLLDFQFSKDQIQFCRNLYWFHPVRREFWDFLLELRFRGDLWAAPEGTPVFPGEPFVRFTAPVIEGLLVESYLLSSLSFGSAVATRAARLAHAAGGKSVLDHGFAWASSAASSVLAARSAYIGGTAGSTLPAAGIECGVPVHNAQGESFARAFASEREAMRAWSATFHETAMLRLDGRDPLAGARLVADLGLRARAVLIPAIHPDAPSEVAPPEALAASVRAVRTVLDESALESIKIAVLGPLDETAVSALAASGAPIDAYHIEGQIADPGIALRPRLVCELVEIEAADGPPLARLPRSGERGRRGIKQVFRSFGVDGRARRDVVALATEKPAGAAVLQPWMEGGVVAVSRPGLESIREYTQKALRMLSPELRRLDSPASYPVEPSAALLALDAAAPVEPSA